MCDSPLGYWDWVSCWVKGALGAHFDDVRQAIGKEAQEKGHIFKVFLMVFGLQRGPLGSPVCKSPPGIENGID